MDLFYMARTFRRKTGRKTRSNKKSTRRSRRKVGGSKATTLLVALAALAAPKAAAVPARAYPTKPVNITVDGIELVATPNGSGYNINKDVIVAKLGSDTLKDLERLDNSWFPKKDVLSISHEDIKKYNMRTLRDDITSADLAKASEYQSPW